MLSRKQAQHLRTHLPSAFQNKASLQISIIDGLFYVSRFSFAFRECTSGKSLPSCDQTPGRSQYKYGLSSALEIIQFKHSSLDTQLSTTHNGFLLRFIRLPSLRLRLWFGLWLWLGLLLLDPNASNL